MDLHECFIGNILIKSSFLNISLSHIYCGILSAVIYYAAHRHTEVLMTSQYRVQYDVNVSYSVVDAHMIISRQFIVEPNKNLEKAWNIYFEKSLLFAEKLSLIVSKIHKIEIDVPFFSLLTVEVFDGPGTLCANISPVNKGNKKRYLTSQFQSVIHIYQHTRTKIKFKIKYYEQKIENFRRVYLTADKTLTISYPVNTSVKHIIVKVAPSHLSINLTIKNTIYTGIINSQCKYSGASAYDIVDGFENEISTECFQSSPVLHRNMYSKKEILILVIYSFKEYGSIKGHIEVSTTKCKTVKFNSCLNQVDCSHIQPELCYSERQYINTPCVGDPGSYLCELGTFDIAMGPEVCIVLQLNHSSKHMIRYPHSRSKYMKDMHNCIIKRIKHSSMKARKSVKYLVSGFLSG